jgi:hypothetical protein
MPGSEYYRKQAQLCAQLALISSGHLVISRYNTLALEHLAKAAELDASTEVTTPAMCRPGDERRDMDRD